jgi:hypothetical protein
MDISEAESILDEQLAGIDSVLVGGRNSAAFARWRQTGVFGLEAIFGADHRLPKQFASVTYYIPPGTIVGGFDPTASMARAASEAFGNGIEIQRGILMSALDYLRRFGIPTPPVPAQRSKARVFVTHGHADDVLDAVVHFIEDDLQLTAVVVKREPSRGAAVDDRVEALMDSCDAVVILATADDIVGDNTQPRPNVIHEIGLAQAKMPTRIIYLKEEGAMFPSNVGPKIWESFNRGNYGPVFSKIVRELRGLDLL